MFWSELQSDMDLMHFGTLKIMMTQQLRAEADLRVSSSRILDHKMEIEKITNRQGVKRISQKFWLRKGTSGEAAIVSKIQV